MSSSTRILCGLPLLAWLVLATGCSHFDMSRRIPWKADTSDHPRQANKIMATWTDAVSHNPSRTPQRGFGGRVMFFEVDNDKPVKVEGDLVVYVFDEEGRKPTNRKPDRKYVFPAETLEHHYSESKIGHSYSVWLPWDDVGGPQKEVSLIVRLESKEGAPVVSQQSKIVLRGTKSPSPDLYAASTNQNRRPAADQENVQAVGFDQAVTQYPPNGFGNSAPQTQSDAGNRVANPMKTTTIRIPPNFGRRTPVAEIRSRRKQMQEATPTAAESTTSAEPGSRAPTRSTRFSPSRSRPLGEPISRLSRDHGQRPPRLAGWRSPYRSQSESTTPTSAD